MSLYLLQIIVNSKWNMYHGGFGLLKTLTRITISLFIWAAMAYLLAEP
jgi:hypothetical protein